MADHHSVKSGKRRSHQCRFFLRRYARVRRTGTSFSK